MELHIPKLREGSYFPSLLEPRRRSEQALLSVIQQAYVEGVSTRRVDDLIKALGCDGISSSQVSRICEQLDEVVESFLGRAPGRWSLPLRVAGRPDQKVREGGRIVNVCVVVATGVNADGQREILGMDVGASEDGAFWLAFLRSLTARGLSGVELVTSDAHQGLKNAIAAVFAGASWQRCRTHFMANLLTRVPNLAWPPWSAPSTSVIHGFNLKSPEAIRPKPRSRRGSKLDPYTEHIDRRLGDGLENCVVLLRELRDLGYDGSNTILSEYVRPRRRRRQPEATMRFETEPGEQAQVDWGSLSYIGADGKQRRVWVFVMTLGWSRACYVELVRKADTAAFIQCHVNAFEYLGGVPRRCLYDNAKVVTLGRDEEKRPIWNQRMLDFARRVGFEARLCQPYRAQTKGKVENGVKYVRRHMWPSIRFTDDADLNRQGLEWCDVVANARVHGTTHRMPWEMLAEERPHLGKLPDRATLAPYLREDRKVSRDGFVRWEGSLYGVHWKWVGATVQVGERQGTVEIWAGDERIAVHPRAQQPKQRFILPGQWSGLPRGDYRPRKEAVAVQIPAAEVEQRSLDVYELVAGGVA